MNKIESLKEYPKLDFEKHAGTLKYKSKNIYYSKKNSVLRKFDEDNVIKASGKNLEYLTFLKQLNIEQVNSPWEILESEHEDNKYFIVSKYLKDCIELDYLNEKTDSFENILDCLIQTLQVLEKCHKEDFFVLDLHSSNILVSPNKHIYLFDFDQSLFIKSNKIISSIVGEQFDGLFECATVKELFKNCFAIREEDLPFYNSNVTLLKPGFIEYDKEYVLREMIRLIFAKKRILIDGYEITKRDISKLQVSKKLEKKLVNCLIYRYPLEYNDYLISDLMDLKESRLVRKK